MRLNFAVVRNGKWERDLTGPKFVSQETIISVKNNMNVLFLREAGKRVTNGIIFLFQFPPQSVKYVRAINTNVVTTRHSYVVTQGAAGAPKFTIRGHFGWQLRTVNLPPFIIPEGVKNVAIYDTHVGDVSVPGPTNDEPRFFTETQRKNEMGVNTQNPAAYQQTLDGYQAYHALHDLILVYTEENMRRLSLGKPPLEMVWIDSLHKHRWVVAPEALPEMDHNVQTQAAINYQLDLHGVYDDTRPRRKKGDIVW